MNTVVLVGRLTGNPEVTVTENGKHITKILLAVNRNYKNADGIYETDFIRVVLWNNAALNAKEYCKSGDLLGIKGRIQVSTYKDSENNTRYSTEVIAESITFLSSKRAEETILDDEESN